jgi:hypothetical protein
MQNFLKQPITQRSAQLFIALVFIDLVFMILHVLY